MVVKEIKQYYLFRKFIEKLLLVSGLYPLEKPPILYRLIPYANVSAELFFCWGVFGHIKQNIKNVVLVAYVSGPIVSNVVAIVKTYCILKHRRDVLDLLKTGDNYFETRINNPNLPKLLGGFSTYWRILCVLTISTIFTYTSRLIVPFVTFISDKIHHIKRDSYPVPVNTVYPWSSGSGRGNELTYLLQYFAQGYIGFIPVLLNCSVEPLFTIIVFRVISEFREIVDRIVHLDEADDPINVIRTCSKQYAGLLKSCDTIQKIFGPIILQMLISNALVLCTSVFIISQIKVDMVYLLFFIAYVCAKMSQTCVCAFAGSQLITESEFYKDAAYATNWHGNKIFTAFVKITLTQNPVTLVACHFTVISLNVLTSVVNTAMSYYFLLKTLQGD